MLKDPILKKYLINTIELIAKSLDPLHLHRKHPFSDRTQFLDYLMVGSSRSKNISFINSHT